MSARVTLQVPDLPDAAKLLRRSTDVMIRVLKTDIGIARCRE